MIHLQGPFARSARSFAGSILVLLALTLSARAQEPLDNQAVIEMVQARLGADIIVEQIRNNPGSYSLTVKSLIRLKQLGVPEKVISAMQAKQAASPAPEKPEASKPPQAEAKAPEKNQKSANPFAWDVHDVADRMSGKKHVEAYLLQSPSDAPPGEELSVKATCDASGMNFLVILDTGTTPQHGFKQNLPSDPINGGGLIPTIAEAARHKNPWVLMQLKIDNHPPVLVSSESEYINYANLFFGRQTLQGGVAEIDNAQGDTDAKMAQALGALVEASGPATADQIFNAHTLLVELPLEDGSKTVLEIRPQDQTFQNFATRCGHVVLPLDANGNVVPLDASGRPLAEVRAKELGPARTRDHFIYGTADTMQSRTFEGTPDDFAAALPGFVQRANTASGLAPQNYDKEIAFISNVAHLCTFTPQIAALIAPLPPNYPVGWENLQPVMEKFGQQYEICKIASGGFPIDVSARANAPTAAGKRRLWMNVSPHGNWRDLRGITVTVRFENFNDDEGNGADAQTRQVRYGVVVANLNGAAPARH
jgi:hypothetical protein